MEPVDYKLVRVGPRVVFSVYSQPKEWTRREDLKNDKTLRWKCEQTGIWVESAGQPELVSDTIYIRGTDEDKDNKIASRAYLNANEAEKGLEKYRTTLVLFNDYLTSIGKPKLQNFFD